MQIYIGFVFLVSNLHAQLFSSELLCSKKYLKFLVFIFEYKDSRFIWNNEMEIQAFIVINLQLISC